MVDTTQSPLAMLVLVTPYTILYLVNQLFLQGVLDNVHYVFFELIFVLAFRKIFGLPDLSEKLFPAQAQVPTGPLPSQQSAKSIKPAKTTLVNETTTEAPAPKKKVKRVIRKQVVKKEVPYAREMAAMETKFFNYINNTEIWEKVFEEETPGLIQVYQYKERPMCYKVIAVMNNTPAVTFDLLSEISRRVEWDPLCVEAKTIADIAPGTKIQYVRTKGMWPTASRDTVVLGTVKDLGEGTYCNITTSVEHPGMPERVKEKFVRMETAIAGQIIGPEPGFPNKCRLVQVLDADLKGWIPEKVIQMVSTKAVPEGMRNVNKLIPKIEPYTESKIIERAALARKDAEVARLATGGEENEEDQREADEEMHVLKARPLLSDRRQSGLLSGEHGLQNGNAHPNHLQHNNNKNTLERKQASTFRVFWEGMKQNLGLGRSGKAESSRASKIVVMTLFLTVLGPTIARWRRNRRR
ncbi:START domain-containing protein 10 [Podila minutissima]|nr:START domain-containing protein 10 [Podila minutissima]